MPKLVNITEEDKELVRKLSGLGITHNQICSIINVTKPTLYKYFQSQLDLGKAQANTKVAENLFRMATGTGREAVTSAIFWLKTQAGWRETDVLEIRNVEEDNAKFRKLVTDLRSIRQQKSEGDESPS
jgi:hypothetical protein